MKTLRSYISTISIGVALLTSGCALNADTSADGDLNPGNGNGDGDGDGDGSDMEAQPIGDEPTEYSQGPVDPEEEEETGIISGNGANALTPEIVALYGPLASLLALDILSPLSLGLGDLVSTLEGRTFLHYAVKCALPKGRSLEITFLGDKFIFPGLVGLAPKWTKAPLTASNRRWMSACLLAHVNLTGAEVSILLRGDHPALNPTKTAAGDAPSGAASAYTIREGAFYGDIFKLVASKHACSGEGSVPTRVCTSSIAGLSPCGFTVPGDCRGLKSACEGDESGMYETCHSGLLLPLLPSTSYPETITVYVKPQ